MSVTLSPNPLLRAVLESGDLTEYFISLKLFTKIYGCGYMRQKPLISFSAQKGQKGLIRQLVLSSVLPFNCIYIVK